MSSVDKPDLYRWQRITHKPLPKKLLQPKDEVTDDVEQWMKKVEQASEFAAAQAFGRAKVGNKSTKAAILSTVDQLHDHDNAYDEAQQLLNDWVKDQLNYTYEDDTEKKIWSDDEDNHSGPQDATINDIIQQTDAGALSMEEYERLMNLEHYYEDDAIESVLSELRQKEVVKPEFLLDLGDIGGKPTQPKPHKDPSVKMQLRQKQVKETREKRQLELLKKREQEQMRKEAVMMAKQKAADDRRKAAEKARSEELEIQKEMNRIRKELQEERKLQLKKQEEERELERRISQVAIGQNGRDSSAIKPSEDKLESYKNPLKSTADIERKKKIVKAIETAELRFTAKTYKIVRSCFNAWFDVVLERRIQMGKARAVADWKSLFRAWNMWRYYTKDKSLERANQEHETNLKEGHRKMNLAVHHYEHRLVHKYFLQWRIWCCQEQSNKELQKDHKSVREKMSTFLATGLQMVKEKQKASECISGADSSAAHQNEVDTLFTSPSKPHAAKSAQNQRKKLISEPWQVTRRHLKMSAKEINAITDTPTEAEDDQGDAWAVAIGELSSHRSDISSKVPKSFQNRFEAQQKILKDQQKALREQRKLIEDLHYMQDKNLLEQQLKQQQAIQEQLEKLTKLTLQEQRLNSIVPKATPHNQNADRDKLFNETTNGHQDEGLNTSRSNASVGNASRVTAASSAFSKRMEQRALERAKAKQEREEKKRQMEEQRVADIIAKEEEMRRQEAEEKKQRIEAYKEKKRLEKQKELEQQLLKEKAQENVKKADDHSKLRVLKFYGFNQLKQHRETMKQLSEEAAKANIKIILRRSFQYWQHRYLRNEAARNNKADELHKKILVRRCFRNWTQWRLQSQILAAKADRHYRSRLISQVFKCWLDTTTREKIEMWEKERHARQHDILRLKCWVMRTWKRLPEDKRKELERERRKDEMRRKVASLLPDYNRKLDD